MKAVIILFFTTGIQVQELHMKTNNIITFNIAYNFYFIGYYAFGHSGRVVVDLSIVISQIGKSCSVDLLYSIIGDG